ncbi:MAG: hypothetical protein ACR2PH_09610 [Desulfobulbia bacterium]
MCIFVVSSRTSFNQSTPEDLNNDHTQERKSSFPAIFLILALNLFLIDFHILPPASAQNQTYSTSSSLDAAKWSAWWEGVRRLFFSDDASRGELTLFAPCCRGRTIWCFSMPRQIVLTGYLRTQFRPLLPAHAEHRLEHRHLGRV